MSAVRRGKAFPKNDQHESINRNAEKINLQYQIQKYKSTEIVPGRKCCLENRNVKENIFP